MKKLIFVLLLACSSEQPYTWGTFSTECAIVYCDSSEIVLGDLPEKDYNRCVRRIEFNLCGLDETCELELPPEAEEAGDLCIETLYALSPDELEFSVFWGLTPPECSDIFSYGG